MSKISVMRVVQNGDGAVKTQGETCAVTRFSWLPCTNVLALTVNLII